MDKGQRTKDEGPLAPARGLDYNRAEFLIKETRAMKLCPRTLSVALCLLVALVAPATAAQAQTIAGHWEGSIDIPGSRLTIDADFSKKDDGSWAGDVSIPAQGAKDLALTNVAQTGDDVTFAIPGIPGDPTFKGKLAADGAKIAGQFTQGGQSFPFELARAATKAAAATEALSGFDQFVEKAIVDWEVPGLAIAVVKGGEVVYSKGFGMRDVDRKLPVTPKTLFAIGSSSKAFTTFVLGTLVDEGKLEWDKPVGNFLPGFRMYDQATTNLITPRDLVTHRSGLPRHDLLWYNNLGISRKEIVSRLPYLEPNEQLRAKWQYNNLMFLTAGYLAEHLTGKSWEDNVRQRVLDPLGMTRTNFSVLDSQKADDFAKPYDERDDKITEIPFRVITTIGPAGSINSSVEDMAKWVALHLGDGKVGGRQVVSPTGLADMHSPHMPMGGSVERPEISQGSYGLGWFVYGYRGHQVVEHGGNIDGFTALVMLVPQDDLGMVILANKNGTGLPTMLARHTIDRVLKLDPIDWNGEALARRAMGEKAEKEAKTKKESVRKQGTKPAHPLADYAGEYEHPGYGVLKVALRNNQLEATFNAIPVPLEHWHYETFNGMKDPKDPTFENMRFLFQTDVKGNVASLAVAFEPSVKDIVFAKKPDARYFDAKYLERFAGVYDLSGQQVTISVKGNGLVVAIPGAPEFHLVPGLGDEFTLKEVSVVGVAFTTDAQGKVTGISLRQPDGVYTAAKKP
jgi:CubicO group peptidase (beta-lactamase class C family)